jgi:hypothetical protein
MLFGAVVVLPRILAGMDRNTIAAGLVVLLAQRYRSVVGCALACSFAGSDVVDLRRLST